MQILPQKSMIGFKTVSSHSIGFSVTNSITKTCGNSIQTLSDKNYICIKDSLTQKHGDILHIN